MIRWLAALLLTLLALGAASAGEREAAATRSDLERIRGAIASHRRTAGELPEDVLALGLVLRAYAPSVSQREGRPLDAWGRSYQYRREDSGFSLYSVGENGIDEGGAGDDLGSTSAPEEPPGARARRRALQFFPLLVFGALAPVVWALLRWARRLAA